MHTVSRTRRLLVAVALTTALVAPAVIVTTHALTDRAQAVSQPDVGEPAP